MLRRDINVAIATAFVAACLFAAGLLVTGPGAQARSRRTGDTHPAAEPAGGNSLRVAPIGSIDVRYTKADSRMLSSAEMSALRDSLHWEPGFARLPKWGATAVSYLLDSEGRKLGSIQITWNKSGGAKEADKGALVVGSFTVEMANASSCGFLGEVELDDPKGEAVVTTLDVDTWVGLNQPAPGQTIRVDGEANLPNANSPIVFRPLDAGFALSACMTPKTP